MLTQNEMLKAVQNRNPDFDGSFLYGVKTTGVFCNPSCSSRHAKPENMVFFVRVEDAQEQGFRACRKCKPDQLDGSDDKAQLARRVCALFTRGC